MKLVFLILVLAVSTQAVSDILRNETGRHWFTLQGKEYFIEENVKANFWTAVQYCYHNNMQLVSLGTQEENDALYNQVDQFLAGQAEFWSSGSRIANDDDWIWLTTGWPIKVFNWGDGEPNNKGKKERCISLYYRHYQNGWWNDENCDNELGVICETKCQD
ncbi:unnamed protein product [Diabrotica balteata]|uniref:C-type lectin domain-containing protein n=1 Tax=Diabrotica balteata TaxID=107213 RepID=A0A9N9T2V4_DIABA|nr:unnamed protein product [Diabrotica balteata]